MDNSVRRQSRPRLRLALVASAAGHAVLVVVFLLVPAGGRVDKGPSEELPVIEVLSAPPDDPTPAPIAPEIPVVPPPTLVTAIDPPPPRPTASRQVTPQRTRPVPAVPAQAATAPATPPPDTLAATEAWRTAVGAWFASRTVYPDEARRRGEEGRATIRFTVGRDGRVLQAELVRGTGSTLLDDAITTLLTQLRASRLPALPAALPQDEVSVTRAINFSLTR